MSNESSNLLKERSSEIMNLWQKRALDEIRAAHFQETLALRNSLPIYLTQLVDALSTTIDRTSARKRFDKDASTRIGRKHGRERAINSEYTMDQMILEYHILRQVICDVLERDTKLSDVDLEVIVCSIEQAVNDAATQYSDTVRDLQEQLSKTLAHDLRVPLNAAKLNAQLMMKKENPDPYYIQKARSISSNMDRLDSMICDLLDVSRLRAGQKLPLEFENFNLRELMSAIVESYNSENKSLVVLNMDSECMVHWNKNGITRLMENLISNALKYGSKEKPVRVNVSHVDKIVSLEVHNDGNEIPATDQADLFEPYKRVKSSDAQIGWGLGLTVVKGMAEGHKGCINLKSEKGTGTSFIVDLPIDPAKSEAISNANRENSEKDRMSGLENHKSDNARN